MRIRRESIEDKTNIRAVNKAAFKTSAEANLVDLLRNQADPLVSIVADDRGKIVGHILFSPVTIDEHSELKLAGLGPMSVLPKRRGEGIGSELVCTGLRACREIGFGGVAVLGHPEYYPRFGFVPAVKFGISCAYQAPNEAFMIQELVEGYLRNVTGTVRFHDAFKSV